MLFTWFSVYILIDSVSKMIGGFYQKVEAQSRHILGDLRDK